MLRIDPKYTIYTHPYDKLINAKTSESSADHLVRGSSAASCIWKIVRMVLQKV